MVGKQSYGEGFPVANFVDSSESQLYEIMSQTKAVIDQNPEQARQVFIRGEDPYLGWSLATQVNGPCHMKEDQMSGNQADLGFTLPKRGHQANRLSQSVDRTRPKSMAANQPNDGQHSTAEITAMYKEQLIDIMTNMKAVMQQDPEQARQILVHNPMLARYLLQVPNGRATALQAASDLTQPPNQPPLLECYQIRGSYLALEPSYQGQSSIQLENGPAWVPVPLQLFPTQMGQGSQAAQYAPLTAEMAEALLNPVLGFTSLERRQGGNR